MSTIGEKYITWHRSIFGEDTVISAPNVYVAVKVYSITSVNEVDQSFKCDFLVMLDWVDPSIIDMGPVTDWNDHFIPRVDVETLENPEVVGKENDQPRLGSDTPGHCKITIRYRATIPHMFNVESYPFDSQVLTIELKFRTADVSRFSSSGAKASVSILALNPKMSKRKHEVDPVDASMLAEWSIADYLGHPSAHDHKHMAVIDSYILHIVISRQWKHTLFNLWSLMLVIEILGFSVYFLDLSDIPNRLNIVVTLLLTAMTFKFVVRDSLPKVPYLTVTDIHVLGGFMLIFMQGLLNLIIRVAHLYDLDVCLSNCYVDTGAYDCTCEWSVTWPVRYGATGRQMSAARYFNVVSFGLAAIGQIFRYTWIVAVYKVYKDPAYKNSTWLHRLTGLRHRHILTQSPPGSSLTVNHKPIKNLLSPTLRKCVGAEESQELLRISNLSCPACKNASICMLEKRLLYKKETKQGNIRFFESHTLENEHTNHQDKTSQQPSDVVGASTAHPSNSPGTAMYIKQQQEPKSHFANTEQQLPKAHADDAEPLPQAHSGPPSLLGDAPTTTPRGNGLWGGSPELTISGGANSSRVYPATEEKAATTTSEVL